MKKGLLFIAVLFVSAGLFAQTELLTNGDFEGTWTGNAPEGWTVIEDNVEIAEPTMVFNESTEFHAGANSAKLVTTKTTKLVQLVNVTAGNSYTVSMWYNLKSGEEDGSNLRIWSTWKDDAGILIADNDAELHGDGLGSDYFTTANNDTWYQYTVTLTAPAAATEFQFEIRTYSNVTAFWDDLSFIDNAPTSVSNVSKTSFSLYPNPVKNVLFVDAEDATKITVLNTIGQQVISADAVSSQTRIDTAKLQSGLYFVSVTDESGKTSIRKFIKK